MPRRIAAPGRGGPGRPRTARPVGALRQPAAGGRAAEQAAVLRGADGELQPDALVAREQRQEAVGRGRADDLDPAGRLERAERGDEIAVDGVEQRAEPAAAAPARTPPAAAGALAGLGERRGRLGAGREPLVEERLHLADERRAGELVGEHRREADRHRGRRLLVAEPAERLEQRQVGVERGLADPVASVRPAPVVEHVRAGGCAA